MDFEALHGYGGGGGGIEINGVGEAFGIYFEALNRGDLVTLRRYFGFDTPIKMANLPNIPFTNSSVMSVAFSPDDTYLVIGGSSSGGYFAIYKKSGESYVKLANPSTMPTTGSIFAAAFSPDMTHLVLGIYNDLTAPMVYKRSGDTFTSLGAAGITGVSDVQSCVYSPDGDHLIMDGTAFKRNGDTYTRITTNGTSGIGPASFAGTPDGIYVAIAQNSTPWINIYKKSGDTYTKLANPTTLPGALVQGVSFSPDGTYLAVAQNGSGSITLRIYKRSGDTFNQLVSFTGVGGFGNTVSFSPDGMYLFFASDLSPYLYMYKRSGDTFTKLPNLNEPIAGSIREGTVRFANLSPLFTVGINVSPWFSMYKDDILGDYLHKYRSRTELDVPNYLDFGVALTNDVANASNKKIKTLPFKL